MRLIQAIAISLGVCVLLWACSPDENAGDVPPEGSAQGDTKDSVAVPAVPDIPGVADVPAVPDVADLKKKLAEHEARNFSRWKPIYKKPPEDRVLPAPVFLLDFLRLDNQVHGYSGVPKAPHNGAAFADDVRAVIAEFPAPVKKHFRDHVLGVFLVSDLGSTAFADTPRDFWIHQTGFIVLDVTALGKTANDWATWREATPFETSAEVTASVRIAHDHQNNQKQAISFILLHELGHLVGAASGSHPEFWKGGDPSKFPFSSLSWQAKDGHIVSRWDETFRHRDKIRFYAEEDSRIPSRLIHGIYTQLRGTDFVSLYASTDVYEDFAETYAMYVHVVLQNRPWSLELKVAGQPLIEFSRPILQERCREKKAYLSRLLGVRTD